MRGNEQEGRMERKQLANNNNGKFVIGSGSSWYGGGGGHGRSYNWLEMLYDFIANESNNEKGSSFTSERAKL